MDPQLSNTSLHRNGSDKVHSVLVIDDDPLVRQSIVMYLEDCGYDVLESETGIKGLEIFFDSFPDIVLCDLRMPEISGMDVLSSISERCPDTPVIMISGAGMISDVVEALRLGAVDYLIKPITDLEVLGHAVRQSLSKRELEKQNQQIKAELENANRELQNHLALLQEDQEAGRRAQIQLLPEPNQYIQGVNFNHAVIPSLNVSGDFLDYFEIDQQHVGFYIADVSGHGSAAAFVTMMLKSFINQPLRDYRSGKSQLALEPSRVIEYLNKELIEANVEKHITLVYGVIDTSTHLLDYAIAGHFPRPIIQLSNEIILLKDRGFPIGMFDWATWETHQIALTTPYCIYMFSDGVLECLSEEPGAVKEESLLKLPFENFLSVQDMIEQLKINKKLSLSDDATFFRVSKLDDE